MKKVKGTTLAGKALKNEGVKAIFTLSGGVLSGIYDTCLSDGIELIDMRHEQAVANAATGYAMATGKPGVAMVTAGPGVVNMVSGMAAAWHVGAPVVGIADHTPQVFEGMGVYQEFDPRELYRSITKWRGYCTTTRRIPEYIATAFRHATTGRQGPVFLEFPFETLLVEVDEKVAPIMRPNKYRTNARPCAEASLIRTAVKWLANAEKPGILVGSGVIWSGASKELMEFAELLNIPVCYAVGGKGAIPDDHPLCGGIVGFSFGSIAGADVLLAIGVRFEELVGYGAGDFYAPDVKVISVDIEPSEIGRNRPIDLGMWGDAKAVLTQLIEEAREAQVSSAKKRKQRKWVEQVMEVSKSIRDILYTDVSSSKKPIHPARLGSEVCKFLGKDSYLIMDGAEIQSYVTPLYCAGFPGSHLLALGGSLGHLGAGIPFAIGVKTAKPDKRVCVVTGDGSFLFNGSEIDTAVRHGKQIVVVIGNDCQWGFVRHDQQLNMHRDVCSKLNDNARYDKYAEGLGAYGELVTEPDQITPALKRAFASGLPAVIDVRTDPSIVSFVSSRGVEVRRKLLELCQS